MKDKKKVYSVISILVISMILILGVSYAVLNYKKTGTNQELIVGDIWMKYTENNQLILEDAMPINIEKYMGYQVNPIMKEQEVEESNELAKCVGYYVTYLFDEGTTPESFCKGTGTYDGGITIQDEIDMWSYNNEYFLEDGGQYFLDSGIILQDGEYYIVNPAMQTQEVEDLNELTKCVNYVATLWFDEGTTPESFCKGTGTYDGRITIQEEIDIWSYNNEYFLEEGGKYLLDNGIIIMDISKYRKYSVNFNITEDEINKCVTILRDEFGLGKNDNESWEDYCQGIGTVYGETFQNNIIDDYFSINQLKILEENNVIIEKQDNLPYLEFKISGKNTYSKKDIFYEIMLTHGDSHETRTTRIKDELLRFSLVEIKEGKENIVVYNEKYENILNKRIWVNTIDKNINEEVDITYRLYMWIDESVVIGNKDQDYTMEEWEEVFASVKVNVNGDFNEKYLETEEKCFEIEEINESSVSIVGYDPSCGSDIGIPSKIDNKNVVEIENKAFYGRSLTSVSIPNTVTTIEDFAFYNNNLKNVDIPNEVTYLSCQAFESIVDLNKKDSLVCEHNYTSESCFTTRDIDLETVMITDYDASCGSDVIIPSIINGKTVVEINSEYDADWNLMAAFENKNLSNVVIPNTVVVIDEYAFIGNNLIVIDIPDSVTTIYGGAFNFNVLNKVILGVNVSEMFNSPFATDGADYSTNKIRHIINKTGKAFNWNDVIGKRSNNIQNNFVTGTIQIDSGSTKIEFTIQVTSE